MKKRLALFVLTVALGVLGFTAASVAVAATQTPPGTPPGQGDCQHGNSGKACGDDPQPDNGKDCQAHGNNGGVNEDHCAPVETTTGETTTEGTTTQETTTQGTTTQSTTTTQVTTTETPGGQTTPTVTPTLDAGSSTSTETTSSTPNSADDSAGETSTASSAGKAAAAPKKHAVLGASAVAPKPTRRAQEAPFTL